MNGWKIAHTPIRFRRFLNIVQVSNELESERSVKSFVESKNEEEESITHSIKKMGKKFEGGGGVKGRDLFPIE